MVLIYGMTLVLQVCVVLPLNTSDLLHLLLPSFSSHFSSTSSPYFPTPFSFCWSLSFSFSCFLLLLHLLLLILHRGAISVRDYWSTDNTQPALDTQLGGSSDVLMFRGSFSDNFTQVEFARFLIGGDDTTDRVQKKKKKKEQKRRNFLVFIVFRLFPLEK